MAKRIMVLPYIFIYNLTAEVMIGAGFVAAPAYMFIVVNE